jgi:hypothetical protein
MDNATPNNPNKRVRINESNNEVTSILRTPSKLSNNAFSLFAVSLLPAISTLAMHFYKRYTKLQVTALQQSIKIEKLSNDEFIPRSASFNFKLGASSRLEESEEFKSLAMDTSNSLKSLQDELKAKILRAATLENELTTKDTKELYCEAVTKLGTIFLLSKTKSDSVSDDTVRKFVLYSIAKDQRSLQYPFAESFTAFEELYKSTYHNNYNVVFEAATQTVTTSATSRSRTPATATMSGRAASNAFADFLLRTTNNDDMSDDNDDNDETTITTAISIRSSSVQRLTTKTLLPIKQ